MPKSNYKTHLKKILPQSLQTWIRKRKSPYYKQPINQTFAVIYQNNYWGNEESVSGAGSMLTTTAILRKALPILLQDYDIRSILDIPCGDFNWMQKLSLKDIQYIGADIVVELIEELTSKYATNHISFQYLDLTKDPLPKVDLILCRDCLVHFSFQHLQQAIDNIRKSEARYLLTTHFDQLPNNIDITTGDWRPLNLEKPPFNWSKPIYSIDEGLELPNYGRKTLALWKIGEISSI